MSDKLDCLIGTYIENGTYMLTSILGQGSYGTTFAATNTELNAKVVVKF
jgi:serine/threonine protein kinase